MIVSASRRTDIPAYYSEWLMGRVEAGYCVVRNPFDARRSTRVSLVPEDVDFLVLWTRDPRPLTPRMRELDARGIRSYAQMTLTGYPAAIEPGSPSLDESIAALRDLSAAIGSSRVLWRYDPVFVAQGLDSDFHRGNFERLAAALEGATSRVTFSLLDEYAGTASRLAKAGYPGTVFGTVRARKGKDSKVGDGIAHRDLFDDEIPSDPRKRLLPEPYAALLSDLAGIARSRGMLPLACAEPYDLSGLGIQAGACVDYGLAASLWGIEAREGKDAGQRRACRCYPSVDIGAYGSCPQGCAYCYASKGSGILEPRGRDDEEL